MEENINPISQEGVKVSLYSKTFLWMFLGLFATGLISVFSFYSGFTEKFIGIFPVLAIIEIVVVLLFSFLAKKISATVAKVLFFAYSIINGIILSTIFAVYQINSIVTVFFAAAAIFGICALFGKTTKFDLSKIGTIFIVTMIVGIILSVINIFLKFDWLNIGIDWVILLVFFGVTAWDMQKVKNVSDSGMYDDDKMSIYLALELYLDFINIFLRILSLFGKRRK